MKLRRVRAPGKGRIEIIPMIDVMFFLLATFMLASLSLQHIDTLAIHMPQGQAVALTHQEPLVLTIDQHGQLQLNHHVVVLAQLAAAIHAQLPADHSLVVAADDAAAHGAVVQAMLQARTAGIEHFMIAIHHE